MLQHFKAFSIFIPRVDISYKSTHPYYYQILKNTDLLKQECLHTDT